MKAAKEALDVALVVSNIDKSLQFYRDLLGLELLNETPLWFGTMYRLHFGQSDFKLIQPKNVPSSGPRGIDAQLGFRYVTFVVQDLSGLCAMLKEKGVEFVISQRELRPGVNIAMVSDPDGNIVEFVERT